MVTTAGTQIDPVKYEVFVHRLWEIGEEGRLALQQVSASPIVVQGGECMSSFYAPDGTMILACSGHLRFAAATSDAIKKLVEWFGDSPGIHEGDQIYFNDPYIAGSHTYDQMVVMPIFHQGELIAWTASSTHTADTGGLLRGGATEIFHEGVRILGLKIVERGLFREDVFKTLVEQCRDPEYVGLDIKARVAANNVCNRRVLELVEKFGPEFIEAASERLIHDAEQLARAKLRQLPDGTWRSRLYASGLDPKTRQAQIIPIACAITKEGDELSIDLTGTGPQLPNDMNSTLPSTLAHVSIALTNQLFWDVPWNDGKMRPVKVTVPEGSILNCRFPAACGAAPMIGGFLVAALSECLAKMLYAGGRLDDVNACWQGFWYWGGPNYLYGGHNREGLTTAQGLYDIHGGGLGAAPTRDGVNTGGHMNIPSGGISDVERIEMQYPFVYFTRRHTLDGAGFGKYRGGYGPERLLAIYGSKDASVDFRPYAAIPHGSFGLFGGHPTGFGGYRAVWETDDLVSRLKSGDYPTLASRVEADGWGRISVPEGSPTRIPLPEHCIVSDFAQNGGGYGDPLERDPALVAREVRLQYTSRRAAEIVYGVVVDDAGQLDAEATRRHREEIRADRKARGTPRAGRSAAEGLPAGGGSLVLRFHEYLDAVAVDDRAVVRCRVCGHDFCSIEENYKEYALEFRENFEQLAGHRVPSGGPYVGAYLCYACPGCATLLQIDTLWLEEDGERRPLWDIQLDPAGLSTGR